MDFTEAPKTVTYILRVHRQGEKIRWTSQKHRKQSLTRWVCTDKEKRSGELHRSTENSHLHSEGAQTGRKDQLHKSTENSHLHAESAQTTIKDQVNFTEALKTITYILRICKQGEKISWTSQKHWKQSLTCWGYTKRSGRLHRSTRNSHLHAECAQTRRKDQVNFTEALKTVTYILSTRRKDQVEFTEALKTDTYMLSVHRQEEKIRWASQRHWNNHLHTEGAQTRRKDQVDFIESQKTVTDILRM